MISFLLAMSFVVFFGCIFYLTSRPIGVPIGKPLPAKVASTWANKHSMTAGRMIVLGTTPPEPEEITEADIAHAEQIKAQYLNLLGTGPAARTLEAEVDELIAEMKVLIVENKERKLQAEAEAEAAKLAMADDPCPECGKMFALNDDYLCDRCRASLG